MRTVIYPDAGHAFIDSTNGSAVAAAYDFGGTAPADRAAAADAWQRIAAFLHTPAFWGGQPATLKPATNRPVRQAVLDTLAEGWAVTVSICT